MNEINKMTFCFVIDELKSVIKDKNEKEKQQFKIKYLDIQKDNHIKYGKKFITERYTQN